MFYFFKWLFNFKAFQINILVMYVVAGLPQGQEKLKKRQKSEKFRKFDKIKKKSDFVSLNLQNSLFSKAFKW